MQELIHKLGIDWKLLLAQAVNFLIILGILRFTVYKPLLKMLGERRRRIEQGLKDSEEASKKLGEVDAAYKQKIAEAEKESLVILSKLERHAKEKEAEILRIAKSKETEILATAEKIAEAKKKESEALVYKEAVSLVKSAVAKAANLKPSLIGEPLIEEAVEALKKSKQ